MTPRGHVYRAGYDALEIAYLHESAEVVRLLGSFRPSTLVAVFPDYVEAVVDRRKEARELHRAAKQFKEVESDSMLEAGELGHDFHVHFGNYEKAVAILDGLAETLHSKLPALRGIEEEKEGELERQRDSALGQRNWANAGIAVTLVLWVISLLITWLAK